MASSASMRCIISQILMHVHPRGSALDILVTRKIHNNISCCCLLRLPQCPYFVDHKGSQCLYYVRIIHIMFVHSNIGAVDCGDHSGDFTSCCWSWGLLNLQPKQFLYIHTLNVLQTSLLPAKILKFITGHHSLSSVHVMQHGINAVAIVPSWWCY